MNYIKILSKSSVLSSSTSEKSVTPSEEITKLQAEVEKLKQTVESLKLTVETRDAAIGKLAREKEKLYVELKTTQRSKRNLHQQLEDERDMSSKEKEYLIEEIKRAANKMDFESNNDFGNNLNGMNNILKEQIRSKDEVICSICTKYLKIKRSKTMLLQEFKAMQSECQQAFENIVMLLEENKKSLDDLLSKLVDYECIPPDSKEYLNILRHNANLHYENTQLKVRLSSIFSKSFGVITNSMSNYYVKKFKDKRNPKDVNVFKCSKLIKRHRKLNKKEYLNVYKTTPNLNITGKSNSDTCLISLQK